MARIDVGLEVVVQGETHERWWRLTLVQDPESWIANLGTPRDDHVPTRLS